MTAEQAAKISRTARKVDKFTHAMTLDQVVSKIEHAANLGLYHVEIPFSSIATEAIETLTDSGFKLLAVGDSPVFITWAHHRAAYD